MIRFYSNLTATLHESHINHYCYGTQTRSSTYVCLLCSRLPHWLTSLLWLLTAYCPGLNSSPGCLFLTALMSPCLRSDCLSECSLPWSKFLVYWLGDTLLNRSISSVIQVVVTGKPFVNIRCSDNNCLPSSFLRTASRWLANDHIHHNSKHWNY
jgi:hypothetical protein